MSGKGKDEAVREAVPLWVVDGLDEAECALGYLAQAVKCVSIAARTELTDPADFIEGALEVLLLAAGSAHEELAGLRDEVEGAVA